MAIEIRRATQDDLPQVVSIDFRNFGGAVAPGDVEIADELLDLDRFVVAVDDGDLVAAGGSFEMQVTVPGGSLAMSGVTWVSVLASHRRRGILRNLMAGLDEMAAELEEPILGLMASEGPIYERFGYGIASRCRVIELDRRRAQIDPSLHPEPVKLVEAADHVDTMLEIFHRYRATQLGEVSRSEALFRDQNIERNKANHAALHRDGYAIWVVEPNWNNGHPEHVLTIKDLIAVTPEAHLALWNLLLSIDLVGPIRTVRTVAHDDPLPYLLTDQRALRTVEANDYLWLKVTDAARCFDARTYRVDDRMVLGVVDGRYATESRSGSEAATGRAVEAIAVGRNGAHTSDEEPDIVLTRAALGPLLMGVSASQLAGGRRLLGKPDALERADALFGTGLLAHCRTSF